MQTSTELICWVNSALRSPFSTCSIFLHMCEEVVTFWPTKAFWTWSTEIIHCSGVTESDVGILIMYFLNLKRPKYYNMYDAHTCLVWDLPVQMVPEKLLDLPTLKGIVCFSWGCNPQFGLFGLSCNLQRSNITESCDDDRLV